MGSDTCFPLFTSSGQIDSLIASTIGNVSASQLDRFREAILQRGRLVPIISLPADENVGKPHSSGDGVISRLGKNGEMVEPSRMNPKRNPNKPIALGKEMHTEKTSRTFRTQSIAFCVVALFTWTLGCKPAKPTPKPSAVAAAKSVDSETKSDDAQATNRLDESARSNMTGSNTTVSGANTTAASETPLGETPITAQPAESEVPPAEKAEPVEDEKE